MSVAETHPSGAGANRARANPAPVILVADDDRGIRTVLTQALVRQGYDVRASSTAGQLWKWVSEGLGDLVITDVIMPDENGLDLVPRIRQARPNLRIVVMSAQNTLMTAIKATERGAFEYLPKPFDLKDLIQIVERALAEPAPVHDASDHLEQSEDGLHVIGRSPAMQEIYRTMARMMSTDLTVIILGESGTGKELIARALHEYGKRREGPFVAVNMAAIPKELIESELFGHERGAFTGAVARLSGRFEQAQGGTLFLDEIGDMPPEAQTRLLRVLQEGEYVTVGGRTPIRADVRIIAATHRDLRALIAQGLFREDLYYRLNVVPIRVPPLRDRTEDIPALVRHFMTQAAASGLPAKTVDTAAMQRLQSHRWPGNVRELENLVRRLCALYSEEVIDLGAIENELSESTPHAPPSAEEGATEGLGAVVERHLREYFAAHADGLPAAGVYDRILREIERPLLALSLEATKGNQLKAADLLGLNRNTLRKKIRELDIQPGRGLK